MTQHQSSRTSARDHKRYSFLRKGAGSPAGAKRRDYSPKDSHAELVEKERTPPVPRLDRLELVDDDDEVPLDSFTTLEEA